MGSEMLVVSGAGLAGIAIVAATVLVGWKGWLGLKLRELEQGAAGSARHAGGLMHDALEDGSAEGAARIEIAALKERIRKLEAIASGVDL